MLREKLLAQLWQGECKGFSPAYYEQLIPPYPEGEAIPRAIHQIYTYKVSVMPKEMQDNILYFKGLDDCTYTLWDEDAIEQFIREHYGETILNNYYRRINPRYGAARADLFRYLLIYKVGGLYLDAKSTLSKQALNALLGGSYTAYLTHWDKSYLGAGGHPELAHIKGGEYLQWMLCYAPGHPLLRQVIIEVLRNIDQYNPFRDRVGKLGVLRLTGPIVYSLAIEKAKLGMSAVDKSRINETTSFVQLGLVYSVFEREGGASSAERHLSVLRTNYNTYTAPIVLPRASWRKVCFALYEPVLRIAIALKTLCKR